MLVPESICCHSITRVAVWHDQATCSVLEYNSLARIPTEIYTSLLHEIARIPPFEMTGTKINCLPRTPNKRTVL